MAPLKEAMARIRELRRFHDVSLDELADELGYSRSSLSRYERGYGKLDYLERERIRQAIGKLAKNG